MSLYAPIDSEVHLFIPVALTDETVAVPVDDLPEEAEDVLNLLRGEEAPLSLWIDFAKAYLAQVWAAFLLPFSACEAALDRFIDPEVAHAG